MTQEEKAKAYDEALERAKSFQQKYGGNYAGYIFPELAESEDERVIKALETFINQPEIADKITFEARIGWLAWLEKQKESLHIPESCKENADSFTSEGERIRKELIDAFSAYDIESSWNGIPVSSVIAWLEKQKEQKPAEWSEEDEKMLHGIEQCVYDNVANIGTVNKYIDFLSSLRPSWKPSEEQMLKGAVEGRVHALGFHNAIYIKEPEWTEKLDKYKEGDKVLVLLLPKEDQTNG